MSLINMLNSEQKKLLSGVPIVWILGGPGSGKRTLSTKIAEAYKCTIISPSWLIQKQMEMDTDIGKVMKYGMIVPDFEMIEEDILWHEIVKSFKFVLNTKKLANSMVIVQGYPLNVKQAKHFVKELKSPDLILLLKTDNDFLEERAEKAEKHGKTYDTDIKKKIRRFHELAEKICEDDNFETKCVKVDASHQEEKVFSDIRNELEKISPKNRISTLKVKLGDPIEVYKNVALVAGLSAVTVCGILAASKYLHNENII